MQSRQAAEIDLLLVEIALEADRLPRIALRQMVPVLTQARRETAQGLSRWLQTVENADQRFTALQYRKVLAQLDQALATAGELQAYTLHGLRLADAAAAPMAFAHIHRELVTFSRFFGTELPSLPYAATINEGSRTLMKRFATSAARYAGAVGQDIRRELAVGMVSGESVREMTARLVRHGGPRGVVAVAGIEGAPGAVSELISEGLFRRYGSWADRLARTEVLNAYNVHAKEGVELAHAVDPQIERMWSAVADRRECAECAGLDGKTAPVGGRFPGGYDDPPAHPYCRCTQVAWRASWNMKEAAA